MTATERRAGRRRAVAVLAAAGLPWSWFAVRDLAPLLDVVATGLPAVVAGLAALAAAVAVVARREAFAVLAASAVAMGAVAVLGPWAPVGGPEPAEPIRVVGVNAYAGNPTPDEAAADVRAQDADVVVIVEGPAGLPERLEDGFAHSAFASRAGHTVFSRFPLRPSAPPGGLVDDRVARWELSPPSGPVVLYTVHLRRPRPRDGAVRVPLARQGAAVDALLEAVARESSPAVVVGDFNLSDRTTAYRRLDGALRDAGRVSWAGPTFVSLKYRPFLLRIDHVFVTRQWCAASSGRFIITGSDHRGVATEVGPCPG